MDLLLPRRAPASPIPWGEISLCRVTSINPITAELLRVRSSIFHTSISHHAESQRAAGRQKKTKHKSVQVDHLFLLDFGSRPSPSWPEEESGCNWKTLKISATSQPASRSPIDTRTDGWHFLDCWSELVLLVFVDDYCPHTS